MNAVDMAQRAYGATAAPVRTNRSTEYAVFTRVTHRLKAATDLGNAGFGAMASALHDNRRLWSILATDVAQEGNDLPLPLRARILYLSQFVNEHSRKVLKGKATADALVEVNTSIMRGLADNGGNL